MIGILLGIWPPLGAEEESPPDETPTSILKREGSWPKFSLHGFGDVTAEGERIDPSGSSSSESSSFAVGELDLFIVSHLSESLSFLTEVVFEQSDEGQGVIDVERFWLKYTVSDRFWTSIGRHHTPLGYWNSSFHHGLLLSPTVDRPEALKFEDDEGGGFLPIHDVGLTSGGSAFRDTWRFDYVGGIFNGRDLSRGQVQSTADLNNQKAVGLNLTFVKEADRRILFGPTVYFDDIPPDPATPGRDGAIDETIHGAHFAYRDDRLEVLAEYYHVDHEDEASSSRYDHSAYFAIAIWRAWKWKPYVGIDRMNLDEGDLYYAGLTDLKRFLAGVRFDLHPFNALKFEYRHDDRPGVIGDALAVQVAFTF